MTQELRCSFCQKSEHEVEKLVAGPAVYICDACVAVADRIMRDAEPVLPVSTWRQLLARVRAGFARVWRQTFAAEAAGPLG